MKLNFFKDNVPNECQSNSTPTPNLIDNLNQNVYSQPSSNTVQSNYIPSVLSAAAAATAYFYQPPYNQESLKGNLHLLNHDLPYPKEEMHEQARIDAAIMRERLEEVIVYYF